MGSERLTVGELVDAVGRLTSERDEARAQLESAVLAERERWRANVEDAHRTRNEAQTEARLLRERLAQEQGRVEGLLSQGRANLEELRQVRDQLAAATKREGRLTLALATVSMYGCEGCRPEVPCRACLADAALADAGKGEG